MIERQKMETHLIPKTSPSPKVCVQCHRKISPGERFHQEEGIKDHLHSLIARHFCSDCYAKYGATILLSGVKK